VSRQTVLTVLTALTVVARFSTRELSLIVRVPARPSRLKHISTRISKIGEAAFTEEALIDVIGR
jgi:hypothetical protein